MSFKVSEDERVTKRSFVWLPWQLFDDMMLGIRKVNNR